MDPSAVRGALSSMVVLYGVNVLSTVDADDTVALIAMMARQEQVGIPEISLTPKRKAVSVPDLQRRVVEMLPGSGMVMARDLLHHFGSVRRIVEADEDELRQVRGIGARKAREMHLVLNAEYEDVDTEKQLEDAIEAEPALLFDGPIDLLERQHYIYERGEDRHIVDLVFRDPEADEVILVELKRGRLAAAHHTQLCDYLDHARESKVLGSFLDRGTALRGLLATVEDCSLKVKDKDISLRIVNRKRTIEVLKQLRQRRLEAMAQE